MKNLIDFIKIFAILGFGVFVGIVIEDDINRDNARKEFKRHTITVGDTTLQIIRDLKIQNETNQVLDIRTIYPGKNSCYVELNSRTGVKIIVMKY